MSRHDKPGKTAQFPRTVHYGYLFRVEHRPVATAEAALCLSTLVAKYSAYAVGKRPVKLRYIFFVFEPIECNFFRMSDFAGRMVFDDIDEWSVGQTFCIFDKLLLR